MRMRFQTRTRVRHDEDRQVERSNRSSSQIPVDLHSGWWGEELQVFKSTEDEKEKEYVEGVFAVALVRGSTLPESQEMETARPRLFFLSRGFALTFLMLICIALAAVLILLLMLLYSESLLEEHLEQNVREHGHKLLSFPPESNYLMGSLPKFPPVCYDLVSQLPLQKELTQQKIQDCPAGSRNRQSISRTSWLHSLSPFYFPHLLKSFSLPSRGSFDTRPSPLLPPSYPRRHQDTYLRFHRGPPRLPRSSSPPLLLLSHHIQRWLTTISDVVFKLGEHGGMQACFRSARGWLTSIATAIGSKLGFRKTQR
jgi:hypothetical protein